jgi:cutinase
MAVSQEVKDHVAAVVSLLKAYSFAMANRAGQVVFGDPMNGMAIPGVAKEKIFTNCAASDPICSYLPIPLGAHLTYGSDSAGLRKTAEFAKSHIS